MLNLNELEAKLDKVLALETQETLTEWLMSKRVNELKELLGEGDIEHFEINELVASYASTIEFIHCEVSKSSTRDSSSAQKKSDTFSIAA